MAQTLAKKIATAVQPGRRYSFMEFCGGHTYAIRRYGLSDLVPPGVHLVHGPGCPVCVLPIGRVDMAIDLALQRGVILCTYVDFLRVPASRGLSLMKAKAQVGDIRMVYSTLDALQVAHEGKRVAICARADAPRLLAAMRAHPLGWEAAVIGEVLADNHHFVQLTTTFGGRRIVDLLSGEPLPRIC